ncbi:MAG: DUF2141 domain-containing protein [Candidatus Cloacimonetes bacterium]|nr:DUF2141 domain-containing protein [Candidatus Cloacimonadota bacterium]
MGKKIILLLFYCLLPMLSIAQITLTIEISDLRNNDGQILFELSKEDEERVFAVTGDILENSCVIVIENLEPGMYAFRYFHDENMNEKLDTNWLGIPKEGFGFSNDPKMTFGPPSFEKTLFELNGSEVLTSKPKYF